MEAVGPLSLERIENIHEGFLKYDLPEYMWYGLYKYLTVGLEPGGFMRALLSNDLIVSFSRADSQNIEKMGDWVKFLYNYMPIVSYGSYEDVENWMKEVRSGEGDRLRQ